MTTVEWILVTTALGAIAAGVLLEMALLRTALRSARTDQRPTGDES